MSADEIETYAVLFSYREWDPANTEITPDTDADAGDDDDDTDDDSEVEQLSPNISFSQDLQDNIQTLSTQNTDPSGAITGFLYVPDLDPDDACYNISQSYVPSNVTRQANLPPTDFTLIAIAPWISANCTHAYMNAAHFDPNRGFIFYLPDNGTDQPPSPSSEVWDLQDGGAWKKQYRYPVYTIPGSVGQELVHQLSLYSGNITDAPCGHDIAELAGVDPRDYVRLYTEIDTSTPSTYPRFWVLILVVFGVLLFVLACTSACMHLVQQTRRHSLRRRVIAGEVNLEALGIKRFTVPQPLIDKLPRFIYSDEGERPQPSSSQSEMVPAAPLPGRNSSSAESKDQASRPTSIESREVLPPEQTIAASNTSYPDAIPRHAYSQPTCAICLEDFESGVTQIRELPCGHIFHPGCIDSVLSTNSSLCPMCKNSVLPVGYCPTKITNGMVRRERNLRRLRPRVRVNDSEAANGIGRVWSQVKYFGSQLRHTTISSLSRSRELPEPRNAQSIPMTDATPAHLRTSVLGIEVSPESRAVQEASGGLDPEDLAVRQSPFPDPQTHSERQRSKWRKALSNVFPGFS